MQGPKHDTIKTQTQKTIMGDGWQHPLGDLIPKWEAWMAKGAAPRDDFLLLDTLKEQDAWVALQVAWDDPMAPTSIKRGLSRLFRENQPVWKRAAEPKCRQYEAQYDEYTLGGARDDGLRARNLRVAVAYAVGTVALYRQSFAGRCLEARVNPLLDLRRGLIVALAQAALRTADKCPADSVDKDLCVAGWTRWQSLARQLPTPMSARGHTAIAVLTIMALTLILGAIALTIGWLVRRRRLHQAQRTREEGESGQKEAEVEKNVAKNHE
jgi:hypothetical protein